MAHIETWYKCPTCKGLFGTQKGAITCKNKHQIIVEVWAVGKNGKAVKVNECSSMDGLGGMNWALKEADMSDNIAERKKEGNCGNVGLVDGFPCYSSNISLCYCLVAG